MLKISCEDRIYHRISLTIEQRSAPCIESMVDTASVSSDASPTQKNGSFLRTSFFGGGGQRRSSQRADNERLESLRVVSSDLLNATRTGDIAQIKSILGKNRSKVPEFIDFPDSVKCLT